MPSRRDLSDIANYPVPNQGDEAQDGDDRDMDDVDIDERENFY